MNILHKGSLLSNAVARILSKVINTVSNDARVVCQPPLIWTDRSAATDEDRSRASGDEAKRDATGCPRSYRQSLFARRLARTERYAIAKHHVIGRQTARKIRWFRTFHRVLCNIVIIFFFTHRENKFTFRYFFWRLRVWFVPRSWPQW